MKQVRKNFQGFIQRLPIRHLLCLPFLLIAPVGTAKDVKPNVLLIFINLHEI
jgi:hypothetical protein